ncbi:MAG: GNAT family N-acetyltransferase [Solirubrobacterales bacterium]|nr:GNAT family N-acetyltransferase [Solirubrobacterales bacterium]
MVTQPVVDLDGRRRSRGAALRDASAVQLRPVRIGDEPALREFVETVSADSLRRRFCGSISPAIAAASLALRLDSDDIVLLAEVPGTPSIVGHAAAYRIGPERAEVAFVIADAWQGRGLGSIMLSRLATAVGEHGVTTLTAEVLPTNQAMLTVFARSPHPVEMWTGADGVEVRIALALPASAAVAA